MPLTVQKLQMRIAELGRAAESPGEPLGPLYVAPAEGPMTPPPPAGDVLWERLDIGQLWGIPHGTSWLRTIIPYMESVADQCIVLQFPWDMEPEDSLLRQMEATVFLDGMAVGGFDWRHPLLAFPADTSFARHLANGESHILTIQVYTRTPLPFGGLLLRVRNKQVCQLYHAMHTLLEVALALDEQSITRYALIERVNAAYNLLDLREGWQSELFLQSVPKAMHVLQVWREAHTSSGTQPEIIVSGHAHLDVAWLWPYWRTRQKIAHTVANVLSLMERFPDYHYSQSQPQLLQWLKEDAPEIYARVKERVSEGRFEPVGAMWVEADCNLTSGESLVRQIMHGTRFLQQEFGITPTVIWLPDVFGYSAALPQIMRAANIGCFMTTKISWSQFNRMPCDTFRWRGIDGSEVLTHFITAPDVNATTSYYTYNGPLRPGDLVGTWRNYRQQAVNDRLLYLAGWGDGGGGPTEDQLERMQALADLPDFPRTRMGRVTDYFAALYERVWDDPHLPRWVGELYLEYHRGTYTSQARVKQANRRAELSYRDVELLNSWAGLYGMPSRQETLNEGWHNILLNQFHDVLPGSSIHEVYVDVERIYAGVRTTGERVRDEALAILSKHMENMAEGDNLFLVNTLPWERTGPIELTENYALAGAQHVTDWEGRARTLIDTITLPSCGAILVNKKDTSTFPTKSGQGTSLYGKIEHGSGVLGNAFYELVLDEHGEVRRLYDKQAERDVIAPGQTANQLIAYEDRPLSFDAWDIDIYYEEKPYPVLAVTGMRLIEEGPVRVTIEIERHFLSSRITQRISLWRSSRRIDFATEIDWHEHQMLLKAAFPVSINATHATYEIQFGSVERPTHRNTSWDWARFEVCAHRWIDLSEGGYGVSLLNDCKYGHDVHDNIMRLTLLKSAISPDRDGDQGLHRFTYSLLPHAGDWREGQTVRRAYELNVPVLSLSNLQPAEQAAYEGEKKTEAFSFLSTTCAHVIVETVKPAEDGNGLIVRLYEAHNQRGRGELTFAAPILFAQECNLLEEPVGDASYQGNTLNFQVRPFEIKTFRVRLQSLI